MKCIELPLKEYLEKRFQLYGITNGKLIDINWLDNRMNDLGFYLELHMEQDVFVHINKHAYEGFIKNYSKETGNNNMSLGEPMNLHQDVISFGLNSQFDKRLEKVSKFVNEYYNRLSDYHTGEDNLISVEVVTDGTDPIVIYSI